MGLGGTLFLPGLDRSPMYVGYWSPGALSACLEGSLILSYSEVTSVPSHPPPTALVHPTHVISIVIPGCAAPMAAACMHACSTSLRLSAPWGASSGVTELGMTARVIPSCQPNEPAHCPSTGKNSLSSLLARGHRWGRGRRFESPAKTPCPCSCSRVNMKVTTSSVYP